MAAGTSLKLEFPSEIRLVDLVHAASEKVAELAGFDEDESLNVALAVREAVINAVLHGNKQDPTLKVRVTLTTSPGHLKAKVQDQGNGFNPNRTPDPTEGPNLLRVSGRGLLLMEAFVDRIAFRKLAGGGTQVTMVKKRPASRDTNGGKGNEGDDTEDR